MSDQQAHTPEPWEVGPYHAIHAPHADVDIGEADGSLLSDFMRDFPEDVSAANAARIVACVNGCAGLNPAGVREVVEAAEKLDAHVENWVEFLRHISEEPDDYAESYRVESDLSDFRAALAAIRGDA